MEETALNKLRIQSPENIYISQHLQGAGYMMSAALQAARLAYFLSV